MSFKAILFPKKPVFLLWSSTTDINNFGVFIKSVGTSTNECGACCVQASEASLGL